LLGMATKKILFISYNGMTDPLGQSQVIPYLSGLTKYGYEFTILSCDKPDRFLTYGNDVRALIKPFPIEWISIPYHKRPPVFASIYDFIQLKKMSKKLQATRFFDMVHTRSGLPALVGLYMKQKYGLKFLNDVRGFWADERIDGGIWSLKNPVGRTLYNFFKSKETEALQCADHTVCLTYAAQTEMHSRKEISNQPIPVEVIPCSVDLDLFNPDKTDLSLVKKFSKELGVTENDFVLSYLGSVGGWYLTDEMMRFCKRVEQRIANAKFLFISTDRVAIIAAAVKYDIPATKLIVQYARRHEVPALLSFSAYSLFFIKPCYSKIASSPTKHGEIMAMGIPVITNYGVGDMEQVISTYQGGYVVDDFSDSSFDNIIEQIKQNKPFNKERIRAGAVDFYALEKAIDRYHSVYRKLLKD
jgi:glycosyltransferase involved in cell wall biosynthesis